IFFYERFDLLKKMKISWYLSKHECQHHYFYPGVSDIEGWMFERALVICGEFYTKDNFQILPCQKRYETIYIKKWMFDDISPPKSRNITARFQNVMNTLETLQTLYFAIERTHRCGKFFQKCKSS